MPTYSYIARNLSGESHSGVIEAEDEHQLARMVRQEGYILVSAKPERFPIDKIKFSIRLPFFNKVSLKEKIFFTRNLQVMVSAGISLPRALSTLSNQAKSKKFKKTLLGLSEEIIKGKNFSDALLKYPETFSELYVNMVKVGEEAGTLEEVFSILIRQMEREHDLKSKVKGAMVYPLVIVSVMFIVGILMMILVIPKLANTFKELGVELPFTTKLVIASGEFLAKFWYTLPVIFIAVFFAIQYILKTKVGKRYFDALFLKFPIIAPLVKKTNSAYTARTLGSLISSGVPIVRALEITANTLTNVFYKEAILDISQNVKKGNKLSESLVKYQKIYSPLVVQMMAVGEEAGETSKMLDKLADFFEDEVSNTTKNLSSIIEPLLMIIAGIAVGFFAVSIIQPIYSIMDTIK